MSMMAYYLAAAATEEGGGLPGPDAPPGAPSQYLYGGDENFGLQWTNGDSEADTLIYRLGVEYASVGPGVTNLDLGLKRDAAQTLWGVQHLKNGQLSATVSELLPYDLLNP